MRISDWSSDVCSSDLLGGVKDKVLYEAAQALNRRPRAIIKEQKRLDRFGRKLAEHRNAAARSHEDHALDLFRPVKRSAERRVGTEGDRRCQSRWTPYHEKKHKSTKAMN